MLRIGIAGIPGTGKTTLARGLASELGKITKKRVALVSEFAREWLGKYDWISLEQQHFILSQQISREEADMQADVMITDSPLQLAWCYAATLINYQDTDPKSRQIQWELLVDLFKTVSWYCAYEPRYDFMLYLPPMQAEADGVRPEHHLDAEFRETIDSFIVLMTKNVWRSRHYLAMGHNLDTRPDNAMQFILENLDADTDQ